MVSHALSTWHMSLAKSTPYAVIPKARWLALSLCIHPSDLLPWLVWPKSDKNKPETPSQNVCRVGSKSRVFPRVSGTINNSIGSAMLPLSSLKTIHADGPALTQALLRTGNAAQLANSPQTSHLIIPRSNVMPCTVPMNTTDHPRPPRSSPTAAAASRATEHLR